MKTQTLIVNHKVYPMAVDNGTPANRYCPVRMACSIYNASHNLCCQPCQIIIIAAFLRKYTDPANTSINEPMSGDICRCGQEGKEELKRFLVTKKRKNYGGLVRKLSNRPACHLDKSNPLKLYPNTVGSLSKRRRYGVRLAYLLNPENLPVKEAGSTKLHT